MGTDAGMTAYWSTAAEHTYASVDFILCADYLVYLVIWII